MPIERLPAPVEGMNNAVALDSMPLRQAQSVVNMLPNQGKLYMRGPISRKVALGSADNIPEVWTYDDLILIKTAGTTRRVDAGSGGSALSTPTRPQESSRHARVGSFVYGAVTPTLGAFRDLGVWNPTGSNIVASANAPVDFVDLKEHLSRLFVLGGSVPGTTTPVNNFNLYWTDLGGPTAGTLAQWQDDTSGLVNQLTYAQQDLPVALARCGRMLAILMRHSIYLLTGDTPASFAVRRVAIGIGCIDRESIAEDEAGVYFMSDSGLAYFDGAQVTIISDNIQGQVTNGLMTRFGVNTYRSAILPRRYVMLSKIDNAVVDGVTYLYSIMNKAWVELRSAAFSASTVCMPIPLANYTFGYDGTDLFDISSITAPEGSSLPGRDDGGGPLKAIQCTVVTRPTKLAGNGMLSQAKRVLVDYVLAADSFGAFPVLLSAVDTRSNSLGALNNLPDRGLSVLRQRAAQEYYALTDSFALTFQMSASTTHYASQFELHDMLVEFEPGTQRPSLN